MDETELRWEIIGMLFEKLGRKPTVEEVQEEMNKSRKTPKSLPNAINKVWDNKEDGCWNKKC